MKIIQTPLPTPAYAYSFAQPMEQIVFFDIETTGLSPKASSLYLIGAMHYDKKTEHWQLTQWFADDYHSEAAILSAFLEYLKPFRALYHFNGATFDIPYVLAKCEKHQLQVPEYARELFQAPVSYRSQTQTSRISVDLLKEIRPFKKTLHLPKANQTALERWLGVHREDTFDGGQLISVYTEYMQKKILQPQSAQKLEQFLFLHNHDDIAGMLEVCSMLSYSDCLHPVKAPVIESIQWGDHSLLTVQFSLPQTIPHAVHLTHAFSAEEHLPENVAEESPQNMTSADRTRIPNNLPEAFLQLEKNRGTVTLPVYHGTLKYFFPQYKDYYYLPEEDTAIHKSVAQFVDAGYRQKATAATCYTKKEGLFLPSCSRKATCWEEPLFYAYYKDPARYYQLHHESEEALSKQLALYLYYELPAFRQ